MGPIAASLSTSLAGPLRSEVTLVAGVEVGGPARSKVVAQPETLTLYLIT